MLLGMVKLFASAGATGYLVAVWRPETKPSLNSAVVE
jgi:hypothetical protein